VVAPSIPANKPPKTVYGSKSHNIAEAVNRRSDHHHHHHHHFRRRRIPFFVMDLRMPQKGRKEPMSGRNGKSHQMEHRRVLMATSTIVPYL
jgi:hypothetical protein